MKKKNGKRKFNNIKRTISGFMKDEDGFITKENILKLGLGSVAALGVLGSLSNSLGAHANHANHFNGTYLGRTLPDEGACQVFEPTHRSHASHVSHPNY